MGTLRFLPGSARRLAATYRALAKARHRDAVYALETDGRDRFVELLRDVDALEEQARLADAEAERSERAMAKKLAALLDGAAS